MREKSLYNPALILGKECAVHMCQMLGESGMSFRPGKSAEVILCMKRLHNLALLLGEVCAAHRGHGVQFKTKCQRIRVELILLLQAERWQPAHRRCHA